MDKIKKEKINITSINPNGTITLTMGGGFYQRLNKLLIDFGDSVDKKKLLESLYLIKIEKTEKDSFAFNLETLIILLRDIEMEFKNTNQTETQEVEVEVPEELKDFADELKNKTK